MTKAENRTKTTVRTGTMAADDSEEILCGCTNMTVGNLRSLLATKARLSFEDVLQTTGAGAKCTACLLNLEYYFVTLPKKTGAGGELAVAGPGKMRPRLSLKRRFYEIVDKISPMVPYRLVNVVPVLGGHGIEEWVWIANQSLLYKREDCAPDTVFGLVVRDGEGRTVHRKRFKLLQNEAARLNVSQFLPSGTTDEEPLPKIGSLEITRRALKPGYRGTTRPQIEIVSRAGSCAVHSQEAGRRQTGGFTCLYRPAEERMFLSIVNAGRSPLNFRVAYPVHTPKVEDLAQQTVHIIVPPKGARLHEVRLPDDYDDRLEDGPLSIEWRATGLYKVHVLCGRPDLERFSIDHL